jgi:flagellar biosynthesis protein FlhA
MAMMAPKTGNTFDFITDIRSRDIIMPTVLVGILGLMIVPLPTLMLDVLLAINVTLSLLILLTAIQVKRPLELSVFPSLLLVTTLFRLALNVSTTRLILLSGDKGTNAAGEIVETFGSFVVGGSYIVGIVVFLILTLINFVVITKGSGRIAEVGARFTLDALPGKQLSIDSDLASGLITQDEAKLKRSELSRETDFYGAMDGASKFVRGDAIAGLIITFINILGGLVIGYLQKDMTLADAAATYTVLTIGDGLVSQIPALLISTSAGVVVTRAADSADLGMQLMKQIFSNSKVLVAGSVIVVGLALIPGMPSTVFLLLSGCLLWLAKKAPDMVFDDDEDEDADGVKGAAGLVGQPGEESEIELLLPVEQLELEVGYGLLTLVDTREGGEVVSRINGLRQNFARELGIILPPVHIKDNLELGPGEYRLMIHGVETARGDIMSDRLLAMDPGDVRDTIKGIKTVEPAFGLPAIWIRPADRAKAELAGYTVVEPAAVMITHLSELLGKHSHNLLGREELQQLLDVVARRRPRIVDELIPNILSYAEVLSVLRGLLEERVSIRHLASIIECLAEVTRYGKTIPFLIDQVRLRLGGGIVQELQGDDGRLHVAILSSPTEDTLRPLVVRNESDVNLAPDLNTAQNLLIQLQEAVKNLHEQGYPAVILAPTDLRYPLWKFVNRFLGQGHVLAQNELPSNTDIVTEYTVSLPMTPAPQGAAVFSADSQQ